MWYPSELVDSLARIESDLGERHPLLKWRQEFEAGRYPDSEEPTGDERGAALDAALETARASAGDEYCDALRMALEARDPPASSDGERKAQIADFLRRILSHAERPGEPILDFWVADAADTIRHHLAPAYSDEMGMVVWRLGLRLRHRTEVAEEFYLGCLLGDFGDGSIPSNARQATAKIALARQLSELMGEDAEDALLAAEFLSEVQLALFAATRNRCNETQLHARRAVDLVRTLESGPPRSPSEPLYRCTTDLHLGERGSTLGWGLEALADALLLTGYYEQALDTLEWGWRLIERPSAGRELELLGRVLRRSRSVGLAT